MINIMFSGNDKVFDGILTCVLSILKRTETQEVFSFYVYTMDVSHLKETYTPISDGKIAYLDRIVKSYDHRHQVFKVDVTDLYMEHFSKSPNEDAYCSPYTLIRLLADLVPNRPKKLLYLDVDIMFNRDVKLLYDINIEGYEYAAARDHYGKFLAYPNYINAGVLLFNMDMMIKNRVFEKARVWINKKKLLFADQSALIRSTTRRKMLPQRFNDQKYLHKHTVVRHFSKRLFYLPYPHTANIKQWHIQKVHQVFKYHQFDDVYAEYNYWIKKYEYEIEESHEN